MPEDIYEQDRFFYVNGIIIWTYHNPNANSGDQFVQNWFDLHMLLRILKETDWDIEATFESIGSECKQYCSDVGDPWYYQAKEVFEGEPLAIGTTKETIFKILDAYASDIPSIEEIERGVTFR